MGVISRGCKRMMFFSYLVYEVLKLLSFSVMYVIISLFLYLFF